MSAQVICETERLTIRRLEPADEPTMYAVYSDPVGARFVDDGLPIQRNEVGLWIAKTQENYRQYGYGMFAIMERDSGEVIGFIGLVHPGGQLETEVKYSLLRRVWGQGLGTEAVSAVVAYGRREHALREIIATVDPEHLASQCVLTKCGFNFREDRFNDDGTVTRVFAIAD